MNKPITAIPQAKSQKPITRMEIFGFGFGGLMSAVTYILLFTAVPLPGTARAAYYLVVYCL